MFNKNEAKYELQKNKMNVHFTTNYGKKSDFVVALKFPFERSSIFLNIFGFVKNFTFSYYKYFSKGLKDDWSLLKFFFKKLNINFKFFVSDLKNYVISYK